MIWVFEPILWLLLGFILVRGDIDGKIAHGFACGLGIFWLICSLGMFAAKVGFWEAVILMGLLITAMLCFELGFRIWRGQFDHLWRK